MSKYDQFVGAADASDAVAEAAPAAAAPKTRKRKPMSPEHRARISQALRGRGRGRSVAHDKPRRRRTTTAAPTAASAALVSAQFQSQLANLIGATAELARGANMRKRQLVNIIGEAYK